MYNANTPTVVSKSSCSIPVQRIVSVDDFELEPLVPAESLHNHAVYEMFLEDVVAMLLKK